MLVSAAAVGAVGTPVNAGDASGAFVPTRVVRFETVSGELASAAANSLSVLSAAGAESTTAATAVVIAVLRLVTSVEIAEVIAELRFVTSVEIAVSV